MQNKIPIIGAVVLGVIGLLAVRSYVQRVEHQVQEGMKGQKVVAARVDIAAGTILTEDNVRLKEIPVRYIPPQSIYGGDEVAQVLTRKVNTNIKARATNLVDRSAKQTTRRFCNPNT